jgi:hypothetical protein
MPTLLASCSRCGARFRADRAAPLLKRRGRGLRRHCCGHRQAAGPPRTLRRLTRPSPPIRTLPKDSTHSPQHIKQPLSRERRRRRQGLNSFESTLPRVDSAGAATPSPGCPRRRRQTPAPPKPKSKRAATEGGGRRREAADALDEPEGMREKRTTSEHRVSAPRACPWSQATALERSGPWLSKSVARES